jgi:hypothetical protein
MSAEYPVTAMVRGMRHLKLFLAAFVQMTPATEVQTMKGEVCSLPQYRTSVDTQYGAIMVRQGCKLNYVTT